MNAFADIVKRFDGYAVAGPGSADPEIANLVPLHATHAAFDSPREPVDAAKRLVVVVVEARLLDTLPASRLTRDDLLARLLQLRWDLAREGREARFVLMRPYSGPVRKDGQTLVAIREFFKAVRAAFANFEGVLLVGSFPEASIVRTWPQGPNDRNEYRVGGPIGSFAGRRFDIVLADLTGNWHALYHRNVTCRTHVFTATPSTSFVRHGAMVTIVNPQVTTEQHAMQDVFWIQDENCTFSGPLVILGLVCRNPEAAPGDQGQRNPVARPDINVSRINARLVAVAPPDRRLLGPDGKPANVPDHPSIDFAYEAWPQDPVLERRLLVDYFDRNHAFRTTAAVPRLSLIESAGLGTYALQEGLRGLGPVAEEVNHATLLDFVRWLKRPATLRGISSHADCMSTQMAPVKSWRLWNYDPRATDCLPGPVVGQGHRLTSPDGERLYTMADGRILGWVPGDGAWRLYRYAAVASGDCLAPERGGRWGSVGHGHELVPLVDGKVLDWVPADGSWRLWRYDPSHAADCLPGPAVGQGRWADIGQGHTLLAMPDGQVLDWTPADGRWRLWSYRPERAANCLSDAPNRQGQWGSDRVGHVLRRMRDGQVLDWNPQDGHWRVLRYAPFGTDCLAGPPVSEGQWSSIRGDRHLLPMIDGRVLEWVPEGDPDMVPHSAQLEAETGGRPWRWADEGGRYVPTLLGHRTADFFVLRTAWENGAWADTPSSLLVHSGCDVNGIARPEVGYDQPRYGTMQNADTLLFYGNQLAVLSRASMWNEGPAGFGEAFGGSEAAVVGDGWKAISETTARDAALAPRTTERKENYLWGVVGDWTLRKQYAAPVTSARHLVAARNADGRLELFTIGLDDQLRRHIRLPINYAWASGLPMGGACRRLAVGTNLDGRLELFATGPDDRLQHRWQTEPGGAWTAANLLPGQARQVAVGRNLDGRLELFYTGADDRLFHNWQVAPNGGWTLPNALPGTARQIAVAANADGRLELFYIGPGDQLFHNWQTQPNGGWTYENVLPGRAKQIAVAANADGRLELFYIGTDDRLYHNWQTQPNGSWTVQNMLPGRAKQIAVAANADGRLELFYIGTDDRLYHNWQTQPNGGWTYENMLPGRAKRIAAVANADGRLELFYIGTDDRLRHNWQTEPNGGWTLENPL